METRKRIKQLAAVRNPLATKQCLKISFDCSCYFQQMKGGNNIQHTLSMDSGDESKWKRLVRRSHYTFNLTFEIKCAAIAAARCYNKSWTITYIVWRGMIFYADNIDIVYKNESSFTHHLTFNTLKSATFS